MNSITKQISIIINPDFGKSVEMTDEDKQFCKVYQEGISKLGEDESHLFFVNAIKKSGNCGFTNSGSYDYLVNTSSNTRFRVTVRTFWRCGNESGQLDEVVFSEAGGRYYLGCSDSGYIPVTYYARQIGGEVKI